MSSISANKVVSGSRPHCSRIWHAALCPLVSNPILRSPKVHGRDCNNSWRSSIWLERAGRRTMHEWARMRGYATAAEQFLHRKKVVARFSRERPSSTVESSSIGGKRSRSSMLLDLHQSSANLGSSLFISANISRVAISESAWMMASTPSIDS